MTTLATTLGCLLLLSHPQSKGMLPVIALQTQETTSSPATTQQTSDKTEQPAPDKPKTASTAPKKKALVKTTARKKTAKKQLQSKDGPIVVVSNGGTKDTQGQISFSATDQQTLEKRKNTDDLLATTSTNLKQISGKQLNPGQQEMVKQIHNYMTRSHEATTNGDIQGANNLAVKANLLSKELVKP